VLLDGLAAAHVLAEEPVDLVSPIKNSLGISRVVRTKLASAPDASRRFVPGNDFAQLLDLVSGFSNNLPIIPIVNQPARNDPQPFHKVTHGLTIQQTAAVMTMEANHNRASIAKQPTPILPS